MLQRLVSAGKEAAANGGGREPGGQLKASRGEARSPLTLDVIPLYADTHWLSLRRPAAILFVTDPERTPRLTAAGLRAEFGLTRMEAAVALEILDGHGIKAAAQRLQISPTTARTHLTAVFDKTRTRRQADMVRVLLQSSGTILVRSGETGAT